MHYEEIGERTIPQIEAILGELGKHIGIKLGVPWDVEGESTQQITKSKPGSAPKLSELASFCGTFQHTQK